MRDLTAVLDLFVATEAARDRETLRRGAVDALADLLPCDHVLWGELDLQDMTPVESLMTKGLNQLIVFRIKVEEITGMGED